MASERVAALRMMPRTAEVTVLEPVLRTPRQPTPSPTLLELDKVK